MSKSIGLLERASKLLSGVGLKAPWKVILLCQTLSLCFYCNTATVVHFLVCICLYMCV